MSTGDVSIGQLVSRLEIAQIRSYLLEGGWEEAPSRYAEHLYFVGDLHDGAKPYELYLPESARAAKYHAHLMRAIYKLCGIEDREPNEIVRDILAMEPASDASAESASATRMRVLNSGSDPMQLRVDRPLREHMMMPGEAIELMCPLDASDLLTIERDGTTLRIRISGQP